MSEGPEEPTLAELLAELRAVRAEVGEAREEAGHRFDRVDAGIAQVRADIAAVKVDTAYVEAHIDDRTVALRRHVEDPDAHRRAA
jgi:hypothetical protein